MNKCNKTSAFPILKQYYTKLSFNFIIYSNEKSFQCKEGKGQHITLVCRCYQEPDPHTYLTRIPLFIFNNNKNARKTSPKPDSFRLENLASTLFAL